MNESCGNCGAALPESSLVCLGCGTIREGAAPPATKSTWRRPAAIAGVVIVATLGVSGLVLAAGPGLANLLGSGQPVAPTPIATIATQPSHAPVTPAPRASSTPAAAAIGDGTEILVQSLASLNGARTITFNGSFGGTITAQGVGPVDLSTITMTGSIDVAGQRMKVALDAPTFLGTKLDAVYADGALYYRVLGPMAAMASLDPNGRYTKTPLPLPPVTQAVDPAASVAAMREAVASFDNRPVQLGDERCGSIDCNHVLIRLSDAELATSGSSGMRLTSMTMEVWSRTDTHRPEKLSMSVGAGTQGTVILTFDLAYDQPVSISAPSPDQVAPTPSATSAY